MYEPDEREIAIGTCKAVNEIAEKLNWLIGIGVAILLELIFKF